MAQGMVAAFQYRQAPTLTKTHRTRHRTTVRCPRLQILRTRSKAVFTPAQQAPSFLMVAETPRRNWSSDEGPGTPALILATRSVQQPVA